MPWRAGITGFLLLLLLQTTQGTRKYNTIHKLFNWQSQLVGKGIIYKKIGFNNEWKIGIRIQINSEEIARKWQQSLSTVQKRCFYPQCKADVVKVCTNTIRFSVVHLSISSFCATNQTQCRYVMWNAKERDGMSGVLRLVGQNVISYTVVMNYFPKNVIESLTDVLHECNSWTPSYCHLIYSFLFWHLTQKTNAYTSS